MLMRSAVAVGLLLTLPALAQPVAQPPLPHEQAIQGVLLEQLSAHVTWRERAIAAEAHATDLQKQLDAIKPAAPPEAKKP